MKHKITYSTEGKSSAILKRDAKHIDMMLREAAKCCACEQLPHDMHPLYLQLDELHDRILEEMKDV